VMYQPLSVPSTLTAMMTIIMERLKRSAEGWTELC
jgi:hypothetical protein